MVHYGIIGESKCGWQETVLQCSAGQHPEGKQGQVVCQEVPGGFKTNHKPSRDGGWFGVGSFPWFYCKHPTYSLAILPIVPMWNERTRYFWVPLSSYSCPTKACNLMASQNKNISVINTSQSLSMMPVLENDTDPLMCLTFLWHLYKIVQTYVLGA